MASASRRAGLPAEAHRAKAGATEEERNGSGGVIADFLQEDVVPEQLYWESVEPGTEVVLRCLHPDGNEIVVTATDGLKVRFNLAVGNTATIVVGNESPRIDLHPYNEAHVGIPKDDN